LNSLPSNQDGISQRSSPIARNEILFVTDRRFWRRSIGSEQRIATLILHLARRGEHVAVVYVGRVNRRDRALLTRFLSSAPNLEGLTRRFGRKALWHASRKLMRRPRVPGSSHRAPAIESDDALDEALEGGLERPDRTSPARRAFVQSVIETRQPRIVIVEFSRLTYTVYPRGANAGTCRYWVDTHDILHKRAERYRAAGATVSHPILASQEARNLETYDAILAIQKPEGDQLRDLVPHRPVIVVPHGIELPILPERANDGRQPMRLGFLGGRDESNQHALNWFVDKIWPKIRSRFGEKVELHVAGQVCHAWHPSSDGGSDGIVIVGPIDSIEHFWPSVDIAINPVRFGSGLKIKNVEALAYGRPLITTSIGAEGLEIASPNGLRIADSECEWDRSLDDWLTNPGSATELGHAGRAYAKAHLTEDAAFHALDLQIAETFSETLP
jgi:glycosyltransferase involved in cell wall biosynthesis